MKDSDEESHATSSSESDYNLERVSSHESHISHCSEKSYSVSEASFSSEESSTVQGQVVTLRDSVKTRGHVKHSFTNYVVQNGPMSSSDVLLCSEDSSSNQESHSIESSSNQEQPKVLTVGSAKVEQLFLEPKNGGTVLPIVLFKMVP
jgi:hypothetical protein